MVVEEKSKEESETELKKKPSKKSESGATPLQAKGFSLNRHIM